MSYIFARNLIIFLKQRRPGCTCAKRVALSLQRENAPSGRISQLIAMAYLFLNPLEGLLLTILRNPTKKNKILSDQRSTTQT